MRASCHGTLAWFLNESDDAIVGVLSTAGSNQGFAQQYSKTNHSWRKEVKVLKTAFTNLVAAYPHCAEGWYVIIEYSIPRRQRRIDVVVLTLTEVIPIEFKTGESTFTRSALRQAEDYALDLRDFHSGSTGLIIHPLLVVPDSKNAKWKPDGHRSDFVVPPIAVNADEFSNELRAHASKEKNQGGSARIDFAFWINASYRPIPTILEAAEGLFVQHEVREISHAQSNKKNLAATTDRLLQAIKDARSSKSKVICFVTGIPGAGKTLAGLNLVHNSAIRSDGMPAPVFLSGNGPLVRIVQAALARNSTLFPDQTEAQRVVKTLVQNVHEFVRTATKQEERIVIFDEAQRAWDCAQMRKKLKDRSEFDPNAEVLSEPAAFMKIMDTHPWAVIIALVGAGQEIHDGEAGIEEWGLAISTKFPKWKVIASPIVLPGGEGLAKHWLFEDHIPATIAVEATSDLHLDVCLRSYRASALTKWVDSVIEGDADSAKAIVSELKDFPVLLTRKLDAARSWLRKQARGTRRCGLLASSGALRLRADGLEMSSGFRGGSKSLYQNWFLADVDDIRSANQLEVAASEFECQGLELDHCGICWGEDLSWDTLSNRWSFWQTRGNQRTRVSEKNIRDRVYMLNTYRVLLTRARESIILYIPKGSHTDTTRPRYAYDATADFLLRSGAVALLEEQSLK